MTRPVSEKVNITHITTTTKSYPVKIEETNNLWRIEMKKTYLHFLIPNVLRLERNRFFHSNQAKNLSW